MADTSKVGGSTTVDTESQFSMKSPWYKTKAAKIGFASLAATLILTAIACAIAIPLSHNSSSSSAVANSVTGGTTTTLSTRTYAPSTSEVVVTPTVTTTSSPSPSPTQTQTATTSTPGYQPPPNPTLPLRNFISEVFFSPDDQIIPGDLTSNLTVCPKQYSGSKRTFVELKNSEATTLDLSGASLLGTFGVAYTFPANTQLAPNQYVAIRHNLWDGSAATHVFNGNLGTSNDTISLVDKNGVVLDQVAYLRTYPWDERAGKNDTSLERVSFKDKSTSPINWRASNAMGGTPGAVNSVNELVVGTSYFTNVTTTPANPTSLDKVRIDIIVNTVKTIQSALLRYEIADKEISVATVGMVVNGNLIVGKIPAQPSGTLVRYQILLSMTDGSDEIVPFEYELYPVRSYFVYDAVADEENMNQIWLFGLPTAKSTIQPPPSKLAYPERLLTGIVIKEGANPPQVFDGASVNISKQKNVKAHFLRGNRFRNMGKLKITTESLADPDWSVKMSPMIEYMGFHFLSQITELPTSWADVFVVNWGLGAPRTVQVAVEDINDGFREKRSIPVSGPLLKSSYVDNNNVLDSCYEAVEDAPVPSSNSVFNDAVLTQRVSLAANDTLLENIVDTNSFAAYIAAGVMVANWDGFWNNHFISMDSQGKMTIVPWDLDHVWGYAEVSSIPENFRVGMPFSFAADNANTWQPAFTSNHIFQKLLDTGKYPGFAQKVLTITNDCLVTRQLFDTMASFVDDTAALMTAMVQAAGQTGGVPTITECATKTKAYLTGQKQYLLGEIPKGISVF